MRSEKPVTVPSRLNTPIVQLTVEQFDPASPRRFEIVDLTVGVRCGSALDSPNLSRRWRFKTFEMGILAM